VLRLKEQERQRYTANEQQITWHRGRVSAGPDDWWKSTPETWHHRLFDLTLTHPI